LSSLLAEYSSTPQNVRSEAFTSNPMMGAELVLEMLIFNHLTQLTAQKDFITLQNSFLIYMFMPLTEQIYKSAVYNT
jgi:hypothetical protein